MTSADTTSVNRLTGDPDEAGDTSSTEELSGIDLAKVALRAAREAARKRGSEATAIRKRPKRGTAVRTDGREPAGFGAVLRGLVAERAWNVAVAGGGVLDRWDQIAPDLAANVQAVAFDPDSGRLDLRLATNAHATHLRLTANQLLTRIAEHTGAGVVRTIRVLPAGTQAAAAAASTTAVPPPAPPVVEPREPSAGYRIALEAHRATRPASTAPPLVQAAIDRQTAAMAREPEELFTAALEERLHLEAQQHLAEDVHLRALRRARRERAAEPGTTVPQVVDLRRTA